MAGSEVKMTIFINEIIFIFETTVQSQFTDPDFHLSSEGYDVHK